jgi:hypothetical protein
MPPLRQRSCVPGAVAGVVGIEGGVVSGVFNLETSGVRASDWRPRHDSVTTKPGSSQPADETAVYLFDNWMIRSKVACAIGFANSSMP